MRVRVLSGATPEMLAIANRSVFAYAYVPFGRVERVSVAVVRARDYGPSLSAIPFDSRSPPPLPRAIVA
jgi:hypothetical protein